MGLFSRSEPATHFPEVDGRRIDGTDVALPADLPADATLLVVAFRDDLDPVADQWAALGERLAARHDGRVAVLETPVVDRKMKLLGDLGTVGIRGELDTKRERDRTVVLYADKKAFCKMLDVKTSGVAAFLVARDGEIVWRGDDAIDMDEVVELEAALADLLTRPPVSASDPESSEDAAVAEDAEGAADGADSALAPEDRETDPRPPGEMTE